MNKKIVSALAIINGIATIWLIPYVYHIVKPVNTDWWYPSFGMTLILWGFVSLCTSMWAFANSDYS
jgi:hypothetical protein